MLRESTLLLVYSIENKRKKEKGRKHKRLQNNFNSSHKQQYQQKQEWRLSIPSFGTGKVDQI